MKSTFSRRKFLKASAVAAAPFILPSHIWSAETKPNDRIVLGFIGMGTQNRGLMSGFLGRKDCQVVAVCDVDGNRRDAAKKQVEDRYAKDSGQGNFKGCEAYNDFRDITNRKDIDAVVIATPDHWHAIISIEAAKAKKDIYCEKPLCQSIHEADQMIKAVRKHNVVFQTGSMQRSSKEFRKACELVRNGAIGKVQKVHVAIGGPGIPCNLPAETSEPACDWNMWLGPAPMRPYHSELSPRGVHKHFPNWRNYREYGGGMVTDWGAHHYDIAQWGCGMDESGPVEVFPATSPNAKSGVRYLYDNGVEVIHDSGNGVTFHGTEGKIYVNRGKFEATPAALGEKEIPANGVKLYESNDHRGDWISCIRSRKRPICDVEIGAHTVIVCHLVNLAYYHGEKIKWDPKKLKFVGGTGNPAWLDVPHRDPWKLPKV